MNPSDYTFEQVYLAFKTYYAGGDGWPTPEVAAKKADWQQRYKEFLKGDWGFILMSMPADPHKPRRVINA